MNRFELVAVHTQQPANQNALMEGPGLAKAVANGCAVRHLRRWALSSAMASIGCSQEALARRCGVDRKRIRRWLDGQPFDDYVDAMGAVGRRYLELLEVEHITRRVG